MIFSRWMIIHWTLYWTLVTEKRAWIDRLLAKSAADAPNRGSVFSFEEFQVLATTEFAIALALPFPVWIQKRFIALTLLFGALRSEQLDRFRQGGLQAIEFLDTNRDEDHQCFGPQI